MGDLTIDIDDIESIEDARIYIVERYQQENGNDSDDDYDFADSIIEHALNKYEISGLEGIDKSNIKNFYMHLIDVYSAFHPEAAKELEMEFKKAVSKANS